MCVRYCSEVAFSFLFISIMLINYKAQLLVYFCIVTYMEYDAPPAFPQALRGFPQGEPSASSLDLPADWEFQVRSANRPGLLLPAHCGPPGCCHRIGHLVEAYSAATLLASTRVVHLLILQ